jgi:hypothetical protein
MLPCAGVFGNDDPVGSGGCWSTLAGRQRVLRERRAGNKRRDIRGRSHRIRDGSHDFAANMKEKAPPKRGS